MCVYVYVCTHIHTLFVALRPNAVYDLIHDISRSYTTTHQSVGLLWAGDQLVTENST
jgi:hypothetical protein